MSGRDRSMFTEPATFRAAHGCAPQRVFTCESRRLELTFDGFQCRCGFGRALALGDVASKRDDKPEPILQVVKLCQGHEPLPIELRMLQDHPRQRLHDAWIEIVQAQRREEQLGRIDRPPATQMSEPRITHPPERMRQGISIFYRRARGADRQTGGRDFKFTLKPLGQTP